MQRGWAIVLVMALGASAPAGRAEQGQRPQATFRSDVSYVEVDVLVTDAAGNFVPGLSAADFELFEDGDPQAIATFDEISVPIERLGPVLNAAPVPRDVASNDTEADGRIYLLVLDDLHTAPTNTVRVRRRAREFIERYVGVNDLGAVLHTSGRAGASQDFTSNRELLLASVDAFMGRGLPSAVINRVEDMMSRPDNARESSNEPPRDRDAPERFFAARGLFQTLGNLAEYMASVSGRRKALLLFSEGVDLGSEGSGIGSAGSFSEMHDAGAAMHEAIARATRANVHVYPVDVSGIADPGPGADIRALGESAGLDSSALARERHGMQGTLRTVAERTGGVAIVNTNNLDPGFDRIVRENSQYYLLGYNPPAKRDGRFHAVDVRVNRPGVQVRARAGYYAPGTSAPERAVSGDPLNALLAAALPTPGLPMRLNAPAFRHTDSRARVWVAVDLAPDAFQFADAGEVASENLRLTYQVIDPARKVVASDVQDIRLRLRPETRGEVERLGFRVVFPVDVPAGRYQLRLAARAEHAGRQGSVFTDLIVPDFAAEGLQWSGVAMSSLAAMRVPSRPGDMDAAKQFPLLPSAVRAFRPGDRVAAYAEVYDNASKPAGPTTLSAVVRNEAGKSVFSLTEERPPAEGAGARHGYGFRVEVPLLGLPPGSYLLTLTATPRSKPGAAATREVPFTIAIS